MKVDFLNPFVSACLKVLASEAGMTKLTSDKPQLVKGIATQHAVNVLIGVTGDIEGIVIYGMDLAVAKGIIKSMAGMDMSIAAPMAESALGELGNLITGIAASSLEAAGYPCRISPPVIIRGTGVKFSQEIMPMVALPIASETGEIKILASLNETKGIEPQAEAQSEGWRQQL